MLPTVSAEMPWGLTVTPKDRQVVEASWDPRLYDPPGVRAMLEGLVAVVDRATVSPDLAVAELAPRRPPIARRRHGLAAPAWVHRLARVARALRAT